MSLSSPLCPSSASSSNSHSRPQDFRDRILSLFDSRNQDYKADGVHQDRVTLKPLEDTGFREMEIRGPKKKKIVYRTPLPPVVFGRCVMPVSAEKPNKKQCYVFNGRTKKTEMRMGSRNRDARVCRRLYFAPFLCARNHYQGR